ncbi:uncharacterized protein LOC111584645 isoform X2 [Amphiprion ocellaris]|nr:uncharacterized protein LOC111584645 isoform X2 [Amphiprion ocellaris]
MDTLPCGLLTVCWCAFCVTAEVHRQMEAVAGDDVLLDCRSLHNDVTLLEWIRPDLKADGYVFFYRERRSYENYQHPYFNGRVKLGDLRMENGNMSVLLTNVQPDTDNGTYLCDVSGGTKRRGRTTSSEIKLTVSPAKPRNIQKQIWNGGNKDGGNRDGGNKDGGNKDGGDKDGNNRRRSWSIQVYTPSNRRFLVHPGLHSLQPKVPGPSRSTLPPTTGS